VPDAACNEKSERAADRDAADGQNAVSGHALEGLGGYDGHGQGQGFF
jgi:hypothetical protein